MQNRVKQLIINTAVLLTLPLSASWALPVPALTPPTKPVPVVTVPVPTPTPTDNKNQFNPIVTIKTLAPSQNLSQKTSFVNGIFVDAPSGGLYQVCGSITKANDLQVNNSNRASIDIDGKLYPLTQIAAGSYSFCGNANVKKQEVDVHGVRKDTAKVFNNFVITLLSKTGGAYKNRYTIVNTPSRDTDDNVHEQAMQLVLDDTADEGDRFSDFLTHMTNDLVLSNEALWTDKFNDAFNSQFNHNCNLENIYNTAKANQDSWWASFVMEVFGDVYGLTHDLNGNEIMFLCPESVSIGDADLSATVGTSVSEEFNVNGQIKNVQIRFSFVHRFNSSLIYGNQILEEGTLVINLGNVDMAALVRNLALVDGSLDGELVVDPIDVSQVNAYWENWDSNSYFGETSDSDMDEVDDTIDDKMEGTTTIVLDDPIIELDKDTGNDMTLFFVPAYIYSHTFALIVDEIITEVPADLSNSYSQQDGYTASDNDGFYEIFTDHELGFAMDDDILNQSLHVQTKQGVLNMTASKALSDGTTMTLTLNNAIAPVVSFNGEEDYAIRMDLANAQVLVKTSKGDLQAEYRMDAVAKIDVLPGFNTSMFADLKVIATNVTLTEIKTVKAPDKVLVDQLIKQVISSMVNSKIEPALNAQITLQIESVMNAGAMDLCADINLGAMDGSNNYLTGSVDLVYDEAIDRDDSCFKLTVPADPETNGNAALLCKNPQYECYDEQP